MSAFLILFLKQHDPNKKADDAPHRARQKSGYWKDLVLVAQQIRLFQSRFGLPNDRLPTEYELRRHGYNGGHTILRALRLHGGKRAFLQKLARLDDPEAKAPFASWQEASPQRKVSDARRVARSLKPELEGLARKLGLPGKTLPNLSLIREYEPLLANVICSTPGGYAAIARELNCCIEQQKPVSWASMRRLKPLPLQELKRELLKFIAERTVTPGVMPPERILAKAGRFDLIISIEYHGGSRAVAEICELRDSASWEYVLEMRDLLRELRAYLNLANKGNEMPSIAELQRQGREDLARLIRRHGGPLVFAARFGLYVPPSRRRREADLKWGPFSLALAVRLLDACYQRGRAVDGIPELPPLSELDLELQTEIAEYGGPDTVARRLGLAFARPDGASGTLREDHC
ncbi:hypothetical protein CYME_CMQ170C [Cyanidioschyzon merolae strain 10D]|uniref:Uncharacterized protein n=1 Tax=Cyanidioschyzon merolae (strain NIES-3377 / 10D) TaxID=280699 RepID=M1V6C3_CYAM1|nr:hypothetical protein CYME_CMQ170C [Cyanidioschyzon merolae strain 10D]BAM82070.1 hypothetical protein CYME_CMQ170C [Cyanidioschyzon merolae strain 10D]|eukprot:XP_005538106.1 hypothetical protein CYME_CMQ170C [Cyanidioschyzon merolae strain 10D]